MSVSVGWHCSTRATVLSWPVNTWQSCSRRLAVSSGLLSTAAPNCACWAHSFPHSLPLNRLPLCDVSTAPPNVRSRKFRTSVWERGGLKGGKVVATPANEWCPGRGFLRKSRMYSILTTLVLLTASSMNVCLSVEVCLCCYLWPERRKSSRWGPPLPKGSSGNIKRSPANVYWRSLGTLTHYSD